MPAIDLCLDLSELSFRLGGRLGIIGVSLGLGLGVEVAEAEGILFSYVSELVNRDARFRRDFPNWNLELKNGKTYTMKPITLEPICLMLDVGINDEDDTIDAPDPRRVL